ncbi:hypothetical protein K501DRAFT_289045 [Backusella circina FSU 941]|nr:hypothetical protein K501DRAFT_289045 [Backusella circina FSU 941]
MADIYSQLQFIKITSPTAGQSVEAGSKLTVSYVIQPAVLNGVSMGYAKQLDINLHARSKDTKGQKVAHVCTNCPVTRKEDKYVTYSKEYLIPANAKPGSYALEFIEQVQARRNDFTSKETVKINIVN